MWNPGRLLRIAWPSSFQKAVAYDPELVPAWVELGKLAAKLGDRSALADAIGKLERLAPTEARELAKLRR